MKLNHSIFVFVLACCFSYGLHAQSIREIVYTSHKTSFSLFAPNEVKGVLVRIYNTGIGGEPKRILHLKRTKNCRWTGSINGDLKGLFYTFDAGFGETPGIFAQAVGINGKRGAIINMKSTDPIHWNRDKKPDLHTPADLVIYELHFRDFSIDSSSGFANKGKFLALTDRKAINYLHSLNVNAIHILPSFDFASIDEMKLDSPQYNWGYDPLNYNVPEGSYSTNPYDPSVRIREFKEMVQALHRAGIRVILDVVFNHTYQIKGSNFQLTYPDYFYRKTREGKYSNGSGCGNETASEKPMMRKFMIESIKYWIREYHIDGFRFDLMGVHDIQTINDIRSEVDKIDPSIFIYGEGWSAGHCAYPENQLALKGNLMKMPGVAAFSDDMRDALLGPVSDVHKGAFLAGIPGEEESLKFGIVGAISHPQVDMIRVNYDKKAWTIQPTQQITYVSCHDDLCLVDRLKKEIPNISIDELIRLDELAQTAVFTSQGIPFLFSGEEMLRSKKGVQNSFDSPDSINHLDWTNLKRYPQVYGYYSNLIKLRKDHPAFRLGKAELVRKHLAFLPSQSALVAFVLRNHAGKDPWKNIFVVLNGSKDTRSIIIPPGRYTIVCEKGQINEEGLRTINSSQIFVYPQSALIFHD